MSSWERAWMINFDPNHVYRCVIPLEISLKRKTAKGLTFYEVDFKNHDSPDEWDYCWLVPRGTLPCVWHDPAAPLPPWNPQHEQLYRQGIAAQMAKMSTSTNRLEGELDYGRNAKIVYLFLVRRAVRDPATGKFSSLLIVRTASNLPWNCIEEEESADTSESTSGTEGGGSEGGDDDLFGELGDPINDGTAHGNPK